MLLFKKTNKIKESSDDFILRYNQSDRIPVHLLEIEEEISSPVNIEELIKIESETNSPE